MNETKIEMLVKEILKINKGYELVNFYMIEEDEKILRNLAAAAIHTTLFIEDFYNYIEGKWPILDDEYKKLFFENCGCNKTKEFSQHLNEEEIKNEK